MATKRKYMSFRVCTNKQGLRCADHHEWKWHVYPTYSCAIQFTYFSPSHDKSLITPINLCGPCTWKCVPRAPSGRAFCAEHDRSCIKLIELDTRSIQTLCRHQATRPPRRPIGHRPKLVKPTNSCPSPQWHRRTTSSATIGRPATANRPSTRPRAPPHATTTVPPVRPL